MTQSEELVVRLRTVAESAGATQTREALRQVKTEVQAAEQANRQYAAQVKSTEIANREQAAALRSTAQAARTAGQSVREVGGSFRVGGEDVLRFASALTGVELGLSIFASIGRKIHDAIGESISAQADAQNTARATAAAYGQAAEQFTRFATALSTQTGFTQQSILEAALSARTLSQNYGLTIDQTQRLIAVSADLARVRGIGVAEAFERVQSAIRGEAEASEFLGLTLNATFLQQNAANGAYRQTFTTLTDAQRAQVVYNEVLRQSAQFQGLAAQSASSLDGSMTRAATAARNLSLAFGEIIQPTAIDALQAEARAASDLEIALRKLDEARRQSSSLPGAGGVGNALAQSLPQVGPAVGIVTLINEALHKVAEPEREKALQARQAAIQTQGLLDAQRDVSSQLESSRRRGQQFAVTMSQAQREAQAVKNEVGEIEQSLARINDLRQSVPANSPLVPDLGAAASLQQIEQQIRAQERAQAFLKDQRQILEQTANGSLANSFGAPPNVAAQAANDARRQLDLLNQLAPAQQALADVQERQRQLQEAATQNSAAEAALTLTILPQRERIAQIERDIADSVNKQLQLRQEQNLLLAQQAALQPNNELDDTQAKIQRDKLLLQVRGVNPEERIAARREIRDLSRNVLPAQELSAFDANRRVALAERPERATQLGEDLRKNSLEQGAQSVRDAIKPTTDAIALVRSQGEQLTLLKQVADAVTASRQKAIEVVIQGAVDVLGSGGGSADGAQEVASKVAQQVFDQVFGHLREGLGQAQFPPLVPQSGVRR